MTDHRSSLTNAQYSMALLLKRLDSEQKIVFNGFITGAYASQSVRQTLFLLKMSSELANLNSILVILFTPSDSLTIHRIL